MEKTVAYMLGTQVTLRNDLLNMKKVKFYQQEIKDHGNRFIVNFMQIEKMPCEGKNFSRVVGVGTT